METDQNLQNSQVEAWDNVKTKSETRLKSKKHGKIFWILIPMLIISTLFSLVAAAALINSRQGTLLTQALDKINRPDLGDISQKFATNGFSVFSQKNIDFKNPATCRNLWSQMENKNLMELFYGNNNNFSFSFDNTDKDPNSSLKNFKLEGEGAVKIDANNFSTSMPLKIDFSAKNKEDKEFKVQVKLDTFDSPDGLLVKPTVLVDKFPTEAVNFQLGLNNYYNLFELDLNQAKKVYFPDFETQKNPQIELSLTSFQLFYDSYKDYVNAQNKIQLNFLRSKLNTMMTAQTGQDLLEFMCSNIDSLEAQPIQTLDKNSENKTLRPFKVNFSPDTQARSKKAFSDLSYKFAQDKAFRSFLWSNIELVQPETDRLVKNLLQFTLTSVEANMQAELDTQNLTDDLAEQSRPTKVSICDALNNAVLSKNTNSDFEYKQYLDQYRKYKPDLPEEIETYDQFISYIAKRYFICNQGKTTINQTALAEDIKQSKTKLKEDFLAFEISNEQVDKFYAELDVKSNDESGKNKNSTTGTSFSKNELVVWMDYSDSRIYAVSYDLEATNLGLDPNKIIPDGEVPVDSQNKVKFSLKVENLNSYDPNLKLQEPADSKTLNDLIDVVYSQYNLGKK